MTTMLEQPIVREREGVLERIRVPRVDEAEVANTITHGIGLLLSMAGAVVLIGRALSHGDGWRVAGSAVFVTTLMAVYAASTLSHGFSQPDLKRLFRILDQGLIYLLIVGTYTPFALSCLRTSGWLFFLGVLWTAAFCGFFSKVLFAHRVDSVAVWTCLLLGWMPSVSIYALLQLLPVAAFWWMLAGGLCYSIGTIFLIWDCHRPYFHAVWHVHVIAGSVCHFVAILFFVAPLPLGVA